MFREKLQDREAIIRQTVETAGKRPCAICKGKAETVVSFTPKDPAAFGAGPDDAIYTPLCNRCSLNNLNLEFLEATLKYSGVRQRIDDESSVDDQGGQD